LGCNPATERGSKFNDKVGFNISGELPVRMPVPEFLSELLKSVYYRTPRWKFSFERNLKEFLLRIS
jgi:hypothetical protein